MSKCLDLYRMGLKKCPSANVRRPGPPGCPSESVYLKEPWRRGSLTLGQEQGVTLSKSKVAASSSPISEAHNKVLQEGGQQLQNLIRSSAVPARLIQRGAIIKGASEKLCLLIYSDITSTWTISSGHRCNQVRCSCNQAENTKALVYVPRTSLYSRWRFHSVCLQLQVSSCYHIIHETSTSWNQQVFVTSTCPSALACRVFRHAPPTLCAFKYRCYQHMA